MGFGNWLIVIVSFLIVLGAGWIVLGQINEKQIAYNDFISSNTVNLTDSSSQFYPNLRYADERIAYSIEPVCSAQKELDINRALDILSRKTILEFYLSDSVGGITFLCSNVAPSSENKDHFVAGEGGPTKIINSSNYYIIQEGEVSLFRSEKCDEPKVAIHEILHSLGFDHNNNSGSIMFPVTNCNQKIDSYILDEINRLYGVNSLPDLKIDSVSADRHGKYLDFNISISNVGISDSKGSSLKVSLNDNLVEEYELGEIKVGVKKTLSVGNLRLSRGSGDIKFLVDGKNPTEDLNLDDNLVNISPSGD